MKLIIDIIKIYVLITFHIRYVTNSHTTQKVNPEEGVSTAELATKNFNRMNSFDVPVLLCEDNICSLSVGVSIPFTSITVGGKMIVGYNVVTENTISGEGRLIYSNKSNEKKFTFGLRLSIALEGLDELQLRLDIIWGRNETYYSVGGELGTDLPAVCVPIPATNMYFKLCITVGDYRYFHEDCIIICLRAEIQFCEYRVITLMYSCLNFSKNKMQTINKKLVTVSSFTKSRYDAAVQTLRSIPSFRQNTIRSDDCIKIDNNRQPTEPDNANSNKNLNSGNNGLAGK